MKRFRILTALSAALLTAVLTGCGEKKSQIEVIVRNLTNQTINEVYFYQAKDDKNKNDNILAEDFPAGMNIHYDLGSFTEDECKQGFSLHVVSKENFDESFGKLQLENGDTVVLYVDKTGLSIAINKTDVEIKALQAKSEEENREFPPA